MSLQLCQSAFAPHDPDNVLGKLGAVTTIDWSQVWTWITTHGAPLVLSAIKIVLPALLSGGLTWQTAVQIIEAILAQMQPAPAPTPTPAS